MLDEVVAPGAGAACVGDEPAHGVPLLKPREDHFRTRRLVPPAAPSPAPRRRGLDVDEAVQELEPGVPLPDLLPQVCGRVAVSAGRPVPRAAGFARPLAPLVERQEHRLLSLESRGDEDEARVDREVD